MPYKNTGIVTLHSTRRSLTLNGPKQILLVELRMDSNDHTITTIYDDSGQNALLEHFYQIV